MLQKCVAVLVLGFSWVGAGDSQWLEGARGAALWLQQQAQQHEHGTYWAVEEKEPLWALNNLYAGNAGPVLFFAYMYKVTGEETYKVQALDGANFLLATLDKDRDKYPEYNHFSLYTGLAGVAFVLDEVSAITGLPQYGKGAQAIVATLQKEMQVDERGKLPKRFTEYTDIIMGTAGMGLYLLQASERHRSKDALKMALALGDALLAQKVDRDVGAMWLDHPKATYTMPNFSHGTAGIAFFFARLHQETGEQRFLDAAIEGGQHLLSLANEQGLIYHYSTMEKVDYYLGWCHGPPGTSRLYHQLWKQTKDPLWKKEMEQSTAALRTSGLPNARPYGFWNNVGQCCGSAGVTECALTMNHISGDKGWLTLARSMGADVLERATKKAGAYHWVQAEHRKKPELLQAQVGYMQGASGIGIMLLRLHLQEKNQKLALQLPDMAR